VTTSNYTVSISEITPRARTLPKWKSIEDENRRLKKMFAELSMQNELLKEALGKK